MAAAGDGGVIGGGGEAGSASSKTAAGALANEAAFMENIGLYLNPRPLINLPMPAAKPDPAGIPSISVSVGHFDRRWATLFHLLLWPAQLCHQTDTDETPHVPVSVYFTFSVLVSV